MSHHTQTEVSAMNSCHRPLTLQT